MESYFPNHEFGSAETPFGSGESAGDKKKKTRESSQASDAGSRHVRGIIPLTPGSSRPEGIIHTRREEAKPSAAPEAAPKPPEMSSEPLAETRPETPPVDTIYPPAPAAHEAADAEIFSEAFDGSVEQPVASLDSPAQPHYETPSPSFVPEAAPLTPPPAEGTWVSPMHHEQPASSTVETPAPLESSAEVESKSPPSEAFTQETPRPPILAEDAMRQPAERPFVSPQPPIHEQIIREQMSGTVPAPEAHRPSIAPERPVFIERPNRAATAVGLGLAAEFIARRRQQRKQRRINKAVQQRFERDETAIADQQRATARAAEQAVRDRHQTESLKRTMEMPLPPSPTRVSREQAPRPPQEAMERATVHEQPPVETESAEQSLELRPGQRVLHSESYNYVVDEYNRKVEDALAYGEEFKRQQREIMQDAPQDLAGVTAAAMGSSATDGLNGSLPSGMTTPTLPSGRAAADIEHTLPAHIHLSRGVPQLWPWLVAAVAVLFLIAIAVI